MNLSANQETIVKTAKSCLGKPYLWGAKPDQAPETFDCSSFAQYLYKQIGIDLPRRSLNQAHEGLEVKIDKLETGDLLFFHGTRGYYNEEYPNGIGHVIVYTGNNTFTHASGKDGKVVENSLEEIKKRNDLVVIKRILPS
jgi:cell wall-associated NlpC family hydrolase